MDINTPVTFSGAGRKSTGTRGLIGTALILSCLLGAAQAVPAYDVLNNDLLRFGTGSENSVNSNGNLQQPFYYDGGASQWYQLTYSSYPLDNAIGIGGDGTNEWNINGTVVQNGALTSQVLDTSGYHANGVGKGYGTIVSTGTVTIGGKTLELSNTYELPADKSFVKITTRLTNTSGSSIGNVRLWVGTRDDYVGNDDDPTKQRGNIVNGVFTILGNAATRAAALKIYSGSTGVLFYSTSNKAYTSINNCCSFSNAYTQNPATAGIQQQGDGSYALFVRMADLANGAHEEFTWYYAAGPLASLDSIVSDVAVDQGNSQVAVTASAGTGGTISPASANVTAGATTSFTVTPNFGYEIGAVQGCGGLLNGATFTTGAVNSACAVTASFVLKTYAVTATAGTGGAISPGNATVNHNATTSFTVTPAAGYSLGSVAGCGGSLSGNTFTTGAVTAACTVTASFDINTYSLSATAGTGGSITAGGQVTHGESSIFTITPEAGYSIAGVSGCNGTLVGNTYTTSTAAGSCTVSATFELKAPTFEPAQPAQVDLDATELFTPLPANARPKAYAFDGTELTVTLADAQTRYLPGEHVLTWRATDARGVQASIQQTLHIWPIVSFSPDMTIGGRAGNSDFFRIALNGPAPVYPLTVTYTASGSLQDHDLQSGQVVFNQGEVEKQIGFAVLNSMTDGEADRHAQLTLDEGINRDSRPLTVTFTSLNKAPTVSLALAQDGVRRPSVARDSGPVTIAVDIRDPNSNDTHSLKWSGPSGAVFTSTAQGITIDPSSLPVGVHRFELVVTDNGTPPSESRSTFELVVLETSPSLPEGVADWLPNGLPNDPLYAPNAPNVLPEQSGELAHHVMEAEPGTQLALGSYAVLRGNYQTQLQGALTDSNLTADSVNNVGGYFDFVISHLPRVGDSVSVVIPQRAVIPVQPVYRKFDNATGRWHDFVEDSANRLASAAGEEGFCPPPSSDAYSPGLTAGDWCVRLTIQDGGPNDTDKQTNGSVSDPGGVGALSNVLVTGSSKSGGGSFDLWMLFAIAGVVLLRIAGRQRRWTAFAACAALSGNAAAAEQSHWYAGAMLGQAHSNIDENKLTRQLQQLSYNATVIVDGENRSAWRVHGGYQWNRYLGVEAGYVDLGDIDTAFSGAIADVSQFLADTNHLHPVSGGGVDLSLTARHELGSRFAVHVRSGVFFWNADVRTDGGLQTVKRDDTGSDAVFGVGADLRLYRNLSLSATGTRWGIGGEHIDLVGAGLSWRW